MIIFCGRYLLSLRDHFQCGNDLLRITCDLIPHPLDVRPRSELGKTRDDARDARPRNAELVGAPRPAPPARGEVCIRPPRRASPTELNETAPRSKFSEIGDHPKSSSGRGARAKPSWVGAVGPHRRASAAAPSRKKIHDLGERSSARSGIRSRQERSSGRRRRASWSRCRRRRLVPLASSKSPFLATLRPSS